MVPDGGVLPWIIGKWIPCLPEVPAWWFNRCIGLSRPDLFRSGCFLREGRHRRYSVCRFYVKITPSGKHEVFQYRKTFLWNVSGWRWGRLKKKGCHKWPKGGDVREDVKHPYLVLQPDVKCLKTFPQSSLPVLGFVTGNEWKDYSAFRALVSSLGGLL